MSNIGERAEAATSSLQFIDFAAMSEHPPPPRQWVIDQFLPRRTVTLLAGCGGVGKSLLSQQIGTAVAAGIDWIGDIPRPGAVIGLFGEDDGDEVYRRQFDICRAVGLPIRNAGEGLRYEGRAGKVNNLVSFAQGTMLDAALIEDVCNQLDASTVPVQLLILDNVAQMFAMGGGDENDRGQVTAFVNRLTAVAIKYNIAVLLLTHPAKAEGSEFSGSTTWDAAVRSRLMLERESNEPGSRVILKRMKANYAARGGDVALVWDAGAFRRTDGRKTMAEQVAASSRQRNAERALVGALDWLKERSLSASHKKQAGNFLPKMMCQHGLAEGFGKAELTEALNVLIAEQRVEVDAFLWRDGARNPVKGLRVQPADSAGASNGVSLYKGHTPIDTLQAGSATDRQETQTGLQTDRQEAAAYRATKGGAR